MNYGLLDVDEILIQTGHLVISSLAISVCLLFLVPVG